MLLELTIVFIAFFLLIIKNPIHSVLCLITVFSGVAIYFCLLGLTYIGISYILVYVGAISIIFLFILMLIDIRISELQSDTNNNIFLSIIISFIYFNLFFKYNYNSIFNINILDNYLIKNSIFNS